MTFNLELCALKAQSAPLFKVMHPHIILAGYTDDINSEEIVSR